MAKTGNAKQIKVKIFDAEANTYNEAYQIVEEYDSVEEEQQMIDRLMLKLANKSRLGE